ncbi:methyl-accepting chemotaxis protein [Brevibacillus sp. SYP-B805]|uniref:methyl-accepting chemotaxis protein n=1 Tax=Brevibacillus sp. SYP-B805 TaxID=1578199 RepID=UPI0013EA6102|nr:methyl-accepting chemotaxis protein [Brevibacillus sp. SYP-B805]NGQ94858.1 methyl-accepting chemotaxis protein [Brevibacillus sp. SYP-B805]
MIRTIRTKLIAAFCLVIVVSLLLLGISGTYLSKQLMETLMITSIKKEMTQVENILGEMLKGVDENVHYLANMPVVRKADGTVSHYYDKPTVTKAAEKKRSPVEQEIYNEFERYAQSHPDVKYVYMGTVQGGYVQWPNEDEQANYDPRVRPWYEQSIKQPDAIMRSEPYQYDSPNGPVIVISTTTTVKDSAGNIVGVVGIDQSLDKLSAVIKQIKIGREGYLFLFTPDGTLIAHPNDKLSFHKLDELNKGVKVENTGEQLSYRLSGLNQLLQNKEGSFEMEVDGHPSVVTLHTLGDTGWRMAAVVNQNEVMQYAGQMYFMMGIIGSVCLILSILLGWLLAHSFAKPIRMLKNWANEVAQGNLRVQIASGGRKDEIGQLMESFGQMSADLRQTIERVTDAISHVTSFSHQLSASAEESGKAAEQISAIIQEVAAGTDKQAQGVQESSLAVSEMSSGISRIAGNSQALAANAEQTSRIAIDGGTIIQRAVAQMNRLHATMTDIQAVIKGLDSWSKEIGQITSVITGIADQTNLLALNAAIEAARAGEYGRGFAVVADEVRKLAEEASHSSQRIASLVESIQQETMKATEVMDAGMQEAEIGMNDVHEAGALFGQIQTSIGGITAEIRQMAGIAEQLSAHTQQVNESVRLISQVAQANAEGSQNASAATEEQLAAMQEIASSAVSLNHMAEELQALVQKFRI